MSIQITQLVKSYGLWLCLLVVALPVYAEPLVVGHISFVKGSNAAQQPGEAPRILGKDTEIFQGDNIQTTERSFVIVEFTDGAKITVRPNSNFSIDHYDSQSAHKTAQLVLHQGGVNTSTGDIAQGNPENFQIKTPTSTVKPKSEKAEFTVRICDKDCEEKGKEAAANAVRTEQSVVARVVDIKGVVSAINRADKNAKERPLSLGKPLYNSDAIYSEKDSYALLVFPDGEKVTLQADSELDIKQYNYQIKDKKDQILLRLTTGGLRALTGSIGKNAHDAFALDTPVATIGIRGTGTDSYTDGTSLDHSTWQGLSFLHNEAGEFDVPEGNSSSTSGQNGIPQIYPTPPNAPQPSEPRPDTNKSDPKKVFEEKPPAKGDTLVKSTSGNTAVENNKGEKTTVNEGESSSANSNGDVVTSDQSNDATPENNPSNNGSSFDDADNSLEGCTI
ncbi:MAG: FecR domain-containing protein [Methylobacter sp.]|uniref:FecR family protein n=1 Tax=Methylobacter sp. TaxID=2051955 RepID=UPI00272EFA0C|nr:FecR domain-containing protein [Methylobacter sp.]MDP1664792.1 FecR domain-containing protein [Methylobacter sp.]